jgi:hypothetical protein
MEGPRGSRNLLTICQHHHFLRGGISDRNKARIAALLGRDPLPDRGAFRLASTRSVAEA